ARVVQAARRPGLIPRRTVAGDRHGTPRPPATFLTLVSDLEAAVAYDEDLADRVREVLPHGEAVTERRMFGGLVKDALMARLGPEAAGRALGRPHVRPMDFTGRPMKGMVFIDLDGLQGDALRQWVDAAAGYARALPSKAARK